MRSTRKWATKSRFKQEIPLEMEDPFTRSFRQLHSFLLSYHDIKQVDSLVFISPFLMIITSDDTNGDITGCALESINKFLLYGFINEDSPNVAASINAIASAISGIKFEEDDFYVEEHIYVKLLDLLLNTTRSPASIFLTDNSLWNMVKTCFTVISWKSKSDLLHSTAKSTLTHMILSIFSSLHQYTNNNYNNYNNNNNNTITTVECNEEEKKNIISSGEVNDMITVTDNSSSVEVKIYIPHSIPVMEKLLHYLTSIIGIFIFYL